MEICKAIARRLGCRVIDLDEVVGGGIKRGDCAAVCGDVVLVVEETGVPELRDVEKLEVSIDYIAGRIGKPRAFIAVLHHRGGMRSYVARRLGAIRHRRYGAAVVPYSTNCTSRIDEITALIRDLET